jgi:hypothetical protein
MLDTANLITGRVQLWSCGDLRYTTLAGLLTGSNRVGVCVARSMRSNTRILPPKQPSLMVGARTRSPLDVHHGGACLQVRPRIAGRSLPEADFWTSLSAARGCMANRRIVVGCH